MIHISHKLAGFMLMTTDTPQKFKGIYPSIDDAVEAANKDYGYREHVREVYAVEKNEEDGIIPVYENYRQHIQPRPIAYYIYRINL